MASLPKLFSNKNNATDNAAQATANAATFSPADLAEHSHSRDRRRRQAALAELANRLEAGDLETAELDALALDPLDHLALHLQQDGDATDLNPSDCYQLALQGFSASVRNAAAERLSDLDQLEQLARAAKGHDKVVYRIARDKLDAQRSREREQQAEQQQREAVVEKLERHAQASFDPLYAGKLKSLIDQWHSLQALADDALSQRFEQACARAQARLEERDGPEEPEATTPETVTTTVAAITNDSGRQAIIERVLDELRERIDTPALDEAALRDAQHFLTEQQHQWQESEQHSRPDKDEERAFHRLCTAFETALTQQLSIEQRFGPFEALLPRLAQSPDKMHAEAHALDEWLHELDWPDDSPPPQRKAQVEQALAQHHDQLAEHHQLEIQAVRQSRALMRRCMAAVNDGHLRRASGLLHGVETELARLHTKAHPGLFRQLEETRSAVEQLRDWQSFAVQPKKEALIERMRALVDQSLDPQDRAQTIRAMQDEWRLLSRGLQNQHQELWETFHALAQQAYQPCREFFNEQSKLRALNLEKRHELVEQLNQYEKLTATNPGDIKELDRVLNMARQDWRRFSPVDRAANKPVQKAFDTVLKRLRARLQDEQVDFRRAKEAIIERARALLDEEDTRKATEAAKQLQKEWQSVGTLARRDEQALWKAFRVVCDALFERRGQQVEAFKAELDEHRRNAEQLTTQLEALAQQAEPLHQKAEADAVKAEFRALGALPKAQQKALQDRFDKAVRAFDAACHGQRKQQQDQHWQALFDWVAQARFSERDETDLRQAFAAMSVPPVAASLVDQLPNWRQPASAAALTQMRRCTVELETLVQAESPAEDKALRMELQVQRLADGLGQTVDQARVDAAVVGWLACGPVGRADYDALLARMNAARLAWLTGKI